MASSQTSQQTGTMESLELKSCRSASSSVRQVSATNADYRGINNLDSTAAICPLDSTTQGPPPPPRKAKRKNHRGGKRKKKSKGKNASIGNQEEHGGTYPEKHPENVWKHRIVLELESEAVPVVKAEGLLSQGKRNEDSTPAVSQTRDRLNHREEGASTNDRDRISATSDLDASINESENESITPESITTTISMFHNMVITHGMGDGDTGAKEALAVATGDDAATTVEKALTTAMIAEDETAIAAKLEGVLVEPFVEGADGVDVMNQSITVGVIAAVVEEDAVEEGRDATVAVKQQAPAEVEILPLVVEIEGYDSMAEQDFTIAEEVDCQPSGDDGGENSPTPETVPPKYNDELQQRESPAVQEDSCNCNISIEVSEIRPVDCMYEIKPAPGKGLGMFATGTIRRGTRIIEEEALMVVPEMSYSAILPVFVGLKQEKKAMFMELAGAEDKEEAENLAWYLAEADKDMEPGAGIPLGYEDQAAVQLIFGANSFNMNAHTSGIFPIASRMNHSCIPNVYHTWNTNINRMTVHALRDIAPAEELLTTYIPAILSREQRSDDEHLGNYGFTCNCPACDPRSKFCKPSVSRRASAVAIEEQLAPYFASSNLRDAFIHNTGPLSSFEALRYAQLRVNLLMEEGIMNMDLVKWYAIRFLSPSCSVETY